MEAVRKPFHWPSWVVIVEMLTDIEAFRGRRIRRKPTFLARYKEELTESETLMSSFMVENQKFVLHLLNWRSLFVRLQEKIAHRHLTKPA